MKIYILTKQNYVGYLKGRFTSIGVSDVYVKTKDDFGLSSFFSPDDKLARICREEGSDCYYFLHDGDIFPVGHTSGKIKDRVFTFHHADTDALYSILFVQKLHSIEDLLQMLKNL